MVYSDLKEMFTDAKNLATGANDLQLKSVLLDIQGAVYDLQEENRDLRLKIHELENNNILEGELEYRNGVYTKGNDVFCAVCWDSSKKLIRARKIRRSDSGKTVFFCEVCNQQKIADIPWGK
ncbi:hypothetical protein P7H24_06220 [Enterococcus thailandicus]|uniref:hypothetical protein n=1 Tax=Enterococcus thailandicus TaxID=417368 RepID=UPI00288E18F7|nr:hypothetical protein [Enterococcus thailandicus]MDT2734074.1 hypothetical protein [Enterococcus thailandicus]